MNYEEILEKAKNTDWVLDFVELQILIKNEPNAYEETSWRVLTENSVAIYNPTNKRFSMISKGEKVIIKNNEITYEREDNFVPIYPSAFAIFKKVPADWQQVPFMEAAQAYVDGKRIKVVSMDDNSLKKEFEGEKILSLVDTDILVAAIKCKWYIFK